MRQATLPLLLTVLVTACTSTAERQYQQAQGIVKEHLKAPSTATFTPFGEVERSTTKRGHDLLKFWCEAQNPAGVPIRQNAYATFDPSNGEVVTVTLGASELYMREAERLEYQAQLDSAIAVGKAETEAWFDSLENSMKSR